MNDFEFRLRQLEEQVERLSAQAGMPWSSAMTPGASAGGADPDVVALAQGGNKIEAIRLYRERTGAGLAEAKDAIEGL